MNVSDNTIALILAYNDQNSLAPLAADGPKATMPYGGKYRIVDFPLTNCLHSGIRRILVLTGYNAHTLQKHLRDGWSIFNPELSEFVTPVPPQGWNEGKPYRGNASSLLQNRHLLERNAADYFLVLSGEHVYRMDYESLLRQHAERGADVSVAVIDTATDTGTAMVETDEDLRIRQITSAPAPATESTAASRRSMEVYVFSRQALLDALDRLDTSSRENIDLETDLLPAMLSSQKSYAYLFGGEAGRVSQDHYWEPMLTLDAYYRSNLALLEANPPLDLYQEDWPIRTYQRQTPPARTIPGESGTEGISINSIIAGGTVISGGSVQQSILFPYVRVEDEAFAQDSILMDGVHIGTSAMVRNCIIDKGVKVPAGEKVGFDREADKARFPVTPAGITIIPAGYRFGTT